MATTSTDRQRPARHELSQDTLSFLSGGAKQLLVGGKWADAHSAKTFPSLNPTTEQPLAQVAEADAGDIDDAVAAARAAFDSGALAHVSPHERTRQLLRLATLIDSHRLHLAELISLENGKPLPEAEAEVARARDVIEYFAGWASKFYGETNPSHSDLFSFTLREPVGVCGQIIPWNGPLSALSWKIAPALAFGNSVVLKPAEQTPLVALRVGELILETDLPSGAVNILTGFGPTAGAALVAHPQVDKIAFTGSTQVGRQILAMATDGLKRVSLELGGKSPNIIFPDADLARAASTSAAGIFRNQGQVCCAASRMFVQRDIYDEFTELLGEHARSLTLGDPFDPLTTMGPLISARQRERVLSYFDIAREEGANTYTGGRPGERERGYFVEPTIYTDVQNDMAIARDEIFGPVAVLIPFRDDHDAVLQANNNPYGLAAGVWTRDLTRAHKLARALRAGSIWINCYGLIDPIAPFGGYKQSGFGRELGKHAIELYTEVKSVYVSLDEEATS